MNVVRDLPGIVSTLIPALWAGLILGAGFIAVPAIFAVSEAEKPFAYAAAARVFVNLSQAEWIFAVLLAGSLVALRLPRQRTIAVVTLYALLAAQAIWLRPELLVRAEILASGGSVEPSAAHAVYAGLELCKLAWLAGLAYAGRMLR